MSVPCHIFILLSITLLIQYVSTATTDTNIIGPKIVGGSPIHISKAPYQVSVRLTSRDRRSYGSGHICGGVVISQRVVVTAAHCIYDSDKKKYRKAGEFLLVMGSTYLQSKDSNTQQYYVQQVIPHPSYNHDTLDNDIALIFFNGYIPWRSTTVKSLALNDRQLPASTNCDVSGWGVTRSGNSVSSNTLQKAMVPIISYTDCARGYGIVPRIKLCAGYMAGGIDSCQGDSGGPLMCGNKLAGIVSSGYGCAQYKYPGIYTNVSSFSRWVIETNNTLNYSIYRNAGAATKSIIWLTIFGLLMSMMY